MNVQEEHAALVDGPGRSQDGGNPLVQVVPLGTGTAVWRWIQCDFGQLLLDPLGGRAQRLRDLRIGLGFLGLWFGCGRRFRGGASAAVSVAVAASPVATAAAPAAAITSGGSASGSATRTSTGRHLSAKVENRTNVTHGPSRRKNKLITSRYNYCLPLGLTAD